jgi:hypothetical protein
MPSITTEGSIMLVSGKVFNFLRPEESEFTIEDIAHGISMTCRYGGHCKEFYSVAEHSVLVSLEAAEPYKLEALLHDAAEAFLSDLPTPLKRLLPDYRALEERIERVILSRLGVSSPMSREVKRADLAVTYTEMRMIMPEGTDEWIKDKGVEPAMCSILNHRPEVAKEVFLYEYDYLKNRKRS